MPTKLLSFYLRVGTGAARLALNVTERVVLGAVRAIGLSGRDGARPAHTGRGSQQPQSQPGVTKLSTPPTRPPGPAANLTTVDYDAEPAAPLDRAQELAKTIDDEPDVVEELAEPGAEDGAGATIKIEEPWDGYSEMNAHAVIARVRKATAAELALVELYERAHKRRRTVLAAAERRHKQISGPASS
jgi:hypothetical protein